MDRQPIDSTVIASIGYDRESNEMEVEFCTGRVYLYFMIPPAVFETLIRSDSVGRHFNQKIRNRYRFREI